MAHHAKLHAQVHYRQSDWPCPEAEKWACDKLFSTRGNAKNHIHLHYHLRDCPCPEAEKWACDKLFGTRGQAKAHLQTHYQKELPCPEAEIWACGKLFRRRDTAIKHVQCHYRQKKWPCPEDKKQSCGKLFTRQITARRHAQLHYSQFYCTVPACVNTVSGQSITGEGMMYHMARHKARGHLDVAEKLYEPKAVALPCSNDSVKDKDLHEVLGEDADLGEDTDAGSASAYSDVNDYEGQDNQASGTFDRDRANTSCRTDADDNEDPEADADYEFLDALQEMSEARLPSSKESQEATLSYNNSLRGIKQYCIYLTFVN
jgi:hypothetical protein